MNFERSSPEAAAEREELTPERAREEEEKHLSRFKNLKGKAGLLLGAFLLSTAMGCSEQGKAPVSPERGRGSQNTESPTKKTHIEKREYHGYDIWTKQTLEVDEDGKVIRVIKFETPYGSSERQD